MPLDKEELKKLSPEERIKRLKELERDRKKEIVEAEDLIKRTEAEILENKNIPDIEVPEINPVDITKMFEAPEGLEGTLRNAPVDDEEVKPVKYDGGLVQGEAPGYVPDEHDWVECEIQGKVEDSIKYESAVQKADDLTGSRGVLKKIKKYTQG